MDTSTDALRAVATLLVVDPDAPRYYEAMKAVIRLAPQYPVRLAGEMEQLNALIDLHRKNPSGFAGVLALVERKRAERGLPPLEPAETDKFDKADYMREFMRAKRARTVRAADIENLVRGDRSPLRGNARLEFQRAQAARWNEELTRRIDSARSARGGGRLPKDVLDTLRDQFWASVDAQLDEAEALARRRK